MPGGKKTANPSSHRRDRRLSTQTQNQFNDVFQDPPEASLPQNTLAKVINGKPMGKYVKPRNGSTYKKTLYIPMDERNELTVADISDDTIMFNGTGFSVEDVTYKIVIQTADTDYVTQIVDVVDSETIRVRDTIDVSIADITSCWKQGRINLFAYHDHTSTYLLQIGTDLYTMSQEFGDLTKILKISVKGLQNARSIAHERNEYMIINNSGGLFEVKMDDTTIKYWQLNVKPNGPDERPADVELGTLERYRYLVSNAMVAGTGMFRTPLEEPYPLIHTETAPWYPDKENQDYTEINRNKMIGDGSVTIQAVQGETDVSGDLDTLTNIEYGEIELMLNGDDDWVTYAFDLSSCISFEEIAGKIQAQIRREHPQARVEWNGTSFTIYASEGYNGTVDGEGGTYIQGSEASALGFNTHSRISVTEGEGYLLEDLYMPLVSNYDGSTRQRHYDQYFIYRTMSLGPEGYHINELGSRVGNSPDQFILNKALRAAAVFVVVRDSDSGVITASEGVFEEADKHSILKFEGGEEIEILSVTSSTTATYDTEAHPGGGSDEVCVLGNGRLIKGSQSATTFTSTVGTFSDSDVGAPVWRTDGIIDYIVSVTDSTHVELATERTTDTTGLTLYPVSRKYYDAVYDTKLLTRQAWTAKARFFREMKSGNISAITSGFLFVGRHGRKEIQYCQLGAGYPRWMGYCDHDNQKLEMDQAVTAFHTFPSILSIWTKGKTYSTSLTDVADIGYNEIGYNLFIIATPQEVAEKGIYNNNSIARINDGTIKVVTTDYDWIIFNGKEYYGNTAETEEGFGRMKRALKSLFPQYLAVYTDETGCILWGKQK